MGLTSYLKRGYVACDETDESVSRTLDFSLADRNRAYTNLWCAAAGAFLPRGRDGAFVPYQPAALEIRVENYAPEQWRVARAMLNGRELKDWRVRHADLVKGGTLTFEMTP